VCDDGSGCSQVWMWRSALAGHARGHRRQPRPTAPPFRSWGLTLTFIAVLLGSVSAWSAVALVGAFLAFYLLAVRLTPCRVETKKMTPCRWLVRGVVGTCEWHRGLKRGLPRLMPGSGWGALPYFMWSRESTISAMATVAAEQQPPPTARGVDAIASGADRPAYDWVMLALSGVGVLIALMALLRDFLAG
jgi:hypothetical protein